MTNDLTIRKACHEDICLVRKMADIAFRKTYESILSTEQMEYMMDWMYSDKSLEEQMGPLGHQFFIACRQNEPCGYVSVREDGVSADGRQLFHLEKLYVMPDFQGAGIGSALFNTALDYAKAHCEDAVRVELNVNRYNSAVTFYEKMGMHKSRQGDFPIGRGYYMNDYIMSLDI